MASGQMSIDAQAVSAAVNEIDIAIQDITTRNDKFIALLTETTQQTKGKFTVIKTLQTRIEQEAANLKKAVDATEEIKEAIRNYECMAEEADDDSELRRGM